MCFSQNIEYRLIALEYKDMIETLYLEMNGIGIVVTLDIEDLYHFIIVCPHFANLRKTYTKKYYYFSVLCRFCAVIRFFHPRHHGQ